MSLDLDNRPCSAIPFPCLDCGAEDDGATLARPRCRACSMGRAGWRDALERGAITRGNDFYVWGEP